MTPTPVSPSPSAPVAHPSWSSRRTLLVVLGAGFAMVSVVLFAIGGVGLWAHQQRDSHGYFTAGPERVATTSYALSAPSLEVDGSGPDAFYTDDFLGQVRIDIESSTPGTPVFIGIGPAAAVADYLSGVDHDEVSDLEVDPFELSTTARTGGRPAAAPTAQSFWVGSAAGTGPRTLTWAAVPGDWSVVIMSADGSRGVDVDLSVGGTLPVVRGVTIGALIGGALMLTIGTAVIVLTLTTRRSATAG